MTFDSIWIRSRGSCECSSVACGHLGKCGVPLQSGVWSVRTILPMWLNGDGGVKVGMLEALCEACSAHSLGAVVSRHPRETQQNADLSSCPQDRVTLI